ncbi:hypothetical protein CLOM_g1082 [Closterium sp. NIES-68]|nr:hypothetical protein CLOM_g1082 [Closterium sp. NIES-68]GJP69959.1 hypothetical protein CLOP_g951 [Closterium sp. NIES-67]
MAGQPEPKPTAEDVKMDVFEDDDEFEEFENQDWEESAQDVEVVHQWEDDWDDDDVNDDFSQQLRAEIEKST